MFVCTEYCARNTTILLSRFSLLLVCELVGLHMRLLVHTTFKFLLMLPRHEHRNFVKTNVFTCRVFGIELHKKIYIMVIGALKK